MWLLKKKKKKKRRRRKEKENVFPGRIKTKKKEFPKN